MANPVQVPIPSRVATTGSAVVGVASTAAQQSIPWRRGDFMWAVNTGASTRTITVADNPANSRLGRTFGPVNITAGQTLALPRFAAQDNDVLLVTTNHAEVVLYVVGPTAHPA